MNESEMKTKAKDETKSSPRNLSVLIVGVAVMLVVAGVLLFAQTSSGDGCGENWPCMLYFYTDD